MLGKALYEIRAYESHSTSFNLRIFNGSHQNVEYGVTLNEITSHFIFRILGLRSMSSNWLSNFWRASIFTEHTGLSYLS